MNTPSDATSAKLRVSRGYAPEFNRPHLGSTGARRFFHAPMECALMTQEEFDAEKARQLAALKEWEERRNGR